MAYTKKTWVKGSTPLSAENFNHMEQGIADAHSSIAQLNSDKISGDIKKLSWGGNELQCIVANIGENKVYIPIMWNNKQPPLWTDGNVNGISWTGNRLAVKINESTLYIPVEWS